jgi:hypothetical protein
MIDIHMLAVRVSHWMRMGWNNERIGTYDITSIVSVSWQWNRLISRNRLIWYNLYKQLSSIP